MKIKFLLFFLLFTLYVNGQGRIGFTESEIRTEFYGDTFVNGINDEGDRYIAMKNDFSLVAYYFKTEYGKCYMTKIIPDDQRALNFLVEKYNREYVIVSDTEWKMYSGNGIIRIILIFPGDGNYYFTMFK